MAEGRRRQAAEARATKANVAKAAAENKVKQLRAKLQDEQDGAISVEKELHIAFASGSPTVASLVGLKPLGCDGAWSRLTDHNANVTS